MECKTPVLVRYDNVRIEVREGNGGRLIQEITARNRIVHFGLDQFANLVGYPRTSAAVSPRYIGWGTDGTATIDTQVTLGAETYRNPIVRKKPLAQGIELHGLLTTTEGNGTTYKEIGLFHRAAGYELFGRVTFTGIGKNSGNSLFVIWSILFAAG
jgi:hypothetical protein